MANSDSTPKISTLHLAWAAGFLEGEGSFAGPFGPNITAAQVQREPLDRLASLFGGRIYSRKTGGFSTQPIWIWKLTSHRSVQVAMTLYVLMSPKRQGEIRDALDRWRRARLFKQTGSTTCARGHPLSGKNVYLAAGRYVKCRECRRLNKRALRARLRAQRNGDTS